MPYGLREAGERVSATGTQQRGDLPTPYGLREAGECDREHKKSRKA